MNINKGSVVVVLIVVVAVVLGLILRQVMPLPAEFPTIPQRTAVPAMDLTTTEGQVYTLDPTRSEARFLIAEILTDEVVEVMGKTNQVTGQFAFSADDPQTAQVGEIVIDARALLTDNGLRNRAIANQILRTAQFEFIRFIPTQLLGLPESVEKGQVYVFQIRGDLFMVGATQTATFEIEVSLMSDTEIQGIASTTLRYADFGITIPAATLVQAVDDKVVLELEFTAVKPN